MSDRHTSLTVWEDTYQIHSYEANTKGQATLPFLCQFMQESSWHHAENLGVGFAVLQQKNAAWVLGRQWIKIDTYPCWGDTIKIQTWPTGRERLLWFRDFLILDHNDQPMGQATSAWIIIDLTTRRPQRSRNFNLVLPNNMEHLFPRRPDKVAALSQSEPVFTTTVRYQHLDVNRHVNNVNYIEWMLDGFEPEFFEAHHLQELEINYLAEANYGETTAIYREQNDSLTFLHSVKNPDDHREFCRARTAWQPIKLETRRKQ